MARGTGGGGEEAVGGSSAPAPKPRMSREELIRAMSGGMGKMSAAEKEAMYGTYPHLAPYAGAPDEPIESEDGPVGTLMGMGGGVMMGKELLKGVVGTGGKMLGKAIAKRAAGKVAPGEAAEEALEALPMSRGGAMGVGEPNGPAPIEFAPPVWDDTGMEANALREALAGRVAAKPRPFGEPGPPVLSPGSTPPYPASESGLMAEGFVPAGTPPPGGNWWHAEPPKANPGPGTVNMRKPASASDAIRRQFNLASDQSVSVPPRRK